jgi:allatostatin receptor
MVIYVILSKRKMRTVTNLLLLNLAVADLLFVLICPPFTAIVYAMSNWPLGSVLCKLMHYLLNVTVYVTIYTLVIICVIRYLTIVHGAATSKFRTRTNITILAVTVWAVMLLANSAIVARYNTYDALGGGYTCDLEEGDAGTRDGQVIFMTLFIAGYLLPLATIAAFSILIIRYIAQHRQPSVDRGRSASRKRQASRLIILVVVIFALLWLPVHIYILGCYFLRVFCDHTAVAILTQSLAYFNSCVNPIIYNSTSKDFRDCFHEVATCGRRRAVVIGEATLATRLSVDMTATSAAPAAHAPSHGRQLIINQSFERQPINDQNYER